MFTTNSSVWWHLQICRPDSCTVLKRLRRECTQFYPSWLWTIFLITVLECTCTEVCVPDCTEVEQSPGPCQRKEGGRKGIAECISQHSEHSWCTLAATFTMPICHMLVLKSDLIIFPGIMNNCREKWFSGDIQGHIFLHNGHIFVKKYLCDAAQPHA